MPIIEFLNFVQLEEINFNSGRLLEIKDQNIMMFLLKKFYTFYKYIYKFFLFNQNNNNYDYYLYRKKKKLRK